VISHLQKCHKEQYALGKIDREKLETFVIDTKLENEKLNRNDHFTAGTTIENPSMVNLTTVVDSFTIL
jgi:hypothetical protein